MVGSDSCISQAVLSKLQNTVPHPCEPQVLSRRVTCNVLAMTCPPAEARGFESFSVRIVLSLAAGTVAHPLGCLPGLSAPPRWVFHSLLAAIPKEGKRKTGAGVKSEVACVTFLCHCTSGQN